MSSNVISSSTRSPNIFDEYDSDCDSVVSNSTSSSDTTSCSSDTDSVSDSESNSDSLDRTIGRYCNYILQEWDRNDHKKVESYLNIFNYSERKTIMQDLNTCDCCPRHKANRPTLTDFMKGTMERVNIPRSNNVLKTYEYKCNCKCRQLARSVCRTNNQVLQKKIIG